MYFTQRERHIEALWVCWLTHFSMCVSYRHEWRRGFLCVTVSFLMTCWEEPPRFLCVLAWKTRGSSWCRTLPQWFPLILQEYSTSLSIHFSKNVSVCKVGLKTSNCGIQCVHDLKRGTNCGRIRVCAKVGITDTMCSSCVSGWTRDPVYCIIES